MKPADNMLNETCSSILRYKHNGAILNITYSTLLLAPINTAEHYQLASHLGFNAIKGDYASRQMAD